jgi:hypothetical protein
VPDVCICNIDVIATGAMPGVGFMLLKGKREVAMNALLETLKSLPTIAGNPLAVIAYLVVIGAWLLSYFRTARFKSLIDRISSLPEADRKSILATEMNTVIPETISAEDWLRGKRQLYVVVAYVLTLVVAVLLLVLAFFNRGGLSIDSVGIKTGWLDFVQQAQAESSNAVVNSFQKRSDSSKHDFRFDLILRNSSDKPVTVTNIIVTFDPDESGFLSGAMEISNTYVVMLREDGSGTVNSRAGDDTAHAWYPNTDGKVLIVKMPLQQTLPPLSTDRFVLKIRFPDDYRFKGPMEKAKLRLTWNGTQTTEMTVSLIP